MSILFSDVYKKAIALFDDPKITKAYMTNEIQFDKIMYTYLQNAISIFNNPLSISLRLASYNEPVGTMEVFEADGITNSFKLDDNFKIQDNSVYEYIEGKVIVTGILNKDNRTVTFPDILPEGQQYSFQQYYIGEFLDKFEDFNSNSIAISNQMVQNMIKDILAKLLVKSWAEEERNFLLDIRNIMQDTDFKLMSNDKILSSKNKWLDQIDKEVMQYQNRLAWIIRFMGGSRNLGRG